jgi:hypothetical protein
MPSNKRKHAATFASLPCQNASLYLRPRDVGELPMEAPRKSMRTWCETLPTAAEDGSIALPHRAFALGLVVDFCRRATNVAGRASSIQIMWQKTIRPQLDGWMELLELTAAARDLSCKPLHRHCCAAVADKVRGAKSRALIEAFGPGELAALGGVSGLQDVLTSLLQSDGEAALNEAASSELVVFCVAARGALASRKEAEEHSRAEFARAVDLGLCVAVEEDHGEDLHGLHAYR